MAHAQASGVLAWTARSEDRSGGPCWILSLMLGLLVPCTVTSHVVMWSCGHVCRSIVHRRRGHAHCAAMLLRADLSATALASSRWHMRSRWACWRALDAGLMDVGLMCIEARAHTRGDASGRGGGRAAEGPVGCGGWRSPHQSVTRSPDLPATRSPLPQPLFELMLGSNSPL